MTGTAVSFGTLDWAIVALYFVANTAICIWCALQKEKNTADYFLASRSAGWFLIGSSIFASNIGAEHLIGLAGSGAGSGMAFAHWELHSYLVLVLGWIFAPFYLRAKVFTTPEFLERRYTPGTRTLLSGIFLASYILTKASVTIFAGAFAIQTILGYETDQPAAVRRDGLLLVLGAVPRDHHRRVRGARRHEVRAVDRGHARARAARRLGRAARSSACTRSAAWMRCKAANPENDAPVAAAVDHARDAGLSRLPVRPERRRRGSACCCARPSSGSGTGAPINTSCSACCRRAASRKRAAARSSRRI